jgi:hypothetical protein
MAFLYLPRVQTFLAQRVDENPKYIDSIKVFEFMVGRNRTIGDPIMKLLPASIRVFKAIVPEIETLAFSYYFEGRKRETVIKVIDICLLKDLLK